MNGSPIQDFYESYWQGATTAPEQAQLFLERKARLKSALAPLPAGARILDLGCGDGVFAHFFAEQGLEPIGVDISEAGIRRAQTYYPHLNFRVASLETRLPFDDSEFDAVWCSEVLEHLFGVTFALSEIARVLKPQGVLILTTPYHGLLKNLIVVLRNFDSHFDPRGGHIRFFTRTTLRQLLRENGFVVTHLEGIGRRAPLWMSHWVMARKGGANEFKP